MYLDKIVKTLAPITGTVYDQVAMSFPIPTMKGCCVLYYLVKDNGSDSEKVIQIVTGAMVNASSYTQITANDIFSYEVIHTLQAYDASATFVEAFQQRKKCAKAFEELIAGSDYETQGFSSLKTVPGGKIQHFASEIVTYASMLGLQKMYAELLRDIYGLIE